MMLHCNLQCLGKASAGSSAKYGRRLYFFAMSRFHKLYVIRRLINFMTLQNKSTVNEFQ